MRILKAIGKLLAAMALVVMVWCEKLGRFVVKCLPSYQLPDPQDLVEQYAQAAEAAPAEPSVDLRMLNIQTIADALFRHEVPDPGLAAGLAPTTMAWLAALNADMLLAVSKTTPSELRAHINGQKTIRGLLAYDPESVRAYIEATARQAKEAEPDLEYYRRRPRRREPLLPAFGPMC